MTTKTSHLGLIAYNSTIDSGSYFYDYVNTTSGSEATSNLVIIDTFASQSSASIAAFSASLVAIDASLVIINASLAAITGPTVASASTINVGSNNTDLISASGLAHSNYGKKTVVIPLCTTASLTTADVNYVRIPSELNGWVLEGVFASCTGSPVPGATGGSPVFTVSRISASSADGAAVSMLTTNLTIDEGEYDSSTAKAAAVISATASHVYTGDKIKVANTTSGSNVTFAQVSVTLQNLP